MELAIHGDNRLFSHLPIEPRTASEIDDSLAKRVGQHSLNEVGATVLLAVEVAADKSDVGGVQVTPLQTNPLQIAIRWMALTAQQGQGYASEAFAAVIAILFRESQAHRIVAEIIVDNEPAVRLAERLGL